MRTMTLALAASLVVAISGAAYANSDQPHSQTTGSPGTGNQNCVLKTPGPAGNPYKNPGQMFQDLRADRSLNPAQVAASYPNDFANVGELISKKCGIAPN